MAAVLEERVNQIEFALIKAMQMQYMSEQSIKNLANEMKEFKDEMLAFKNEMKEFKDEMLAFKNEMKDFKDEMKQEVKRINKQWGELSNKLGTIVEDIIFPATRPVLERYFDCKLDTLMMNVKKKRGDNWQEFDVVASSGNNVFLIEVKATLRPEYIQLVQKKIKLFREYFPEYQESKIIPFLASLRIEEEFIKQHNSAKIFAMAYREWEYMDILNFEDLKPFYEGSC